MNNKRGVKKKIRVAILDDHQGTLDGYAYRLTPYKNIDVVASARFGDQLDEMLKNKQVDVLILDVSVPSGEGDPNPYPLLYKLPRLRKQYPDMAILIISMHKQRTLVKAVVDAGAKGYILKDDRQAIVQLGEIVASVAAGGAYFSEQSYAVLTNKLASANDVQSITPRQREVLSLFASRPDVKLKDLAKELNIASSTLRNLLSDSYRRLNVRNLTAAIVRARELGLITPFPPAPYLDHQDQHL